MKESPRFLLEQYKGCVSCFSLWCIFLGFPLSGARQVYTFANATGMHSSVQGWMAQNKLRLDPEKTEFLLIGSASKRAALAGFFPVNL